MIVARMVWNFDMRIAEDSKGWDERSQAFLLWEKGPVNCYITPRKVE